MAMIFFSKKPFNKTGKKHIIHIMVKIALNKWPKLAKNSTKYALSHNFFQCVPLATD